MRPILFIVHVVLLASMVPFASIAGAEQGRQVSIRFPAFSLSPGERVSGIKVAVSQGHLRAGCRPNRWTCDYSGPSVHCYSLHETYATGITGMLPEVIVRDVPGSGSLSIQASVELLDNDGRRSERTFSESELIIR
jgi:hypothetical protein